jgi:serine/threonine-protein kinase RsbW
MVMDGAEILHVPPDFKSLRLVRSYVQDAANEAGLDAKAVYRLTLAVEELTSNIIEHGYAKSGAAQPIRVAATRTARHLMVAVEDEGTPFNIGEATLPDVSLSLDERSRGGLGNLLILKNVDDYRYERVGNCNRNMLFVNIGRENISHEVQD